MKANKIQLGRIRGKKRINNKRCMLPCCNPKPILIEDFKVVYND